MPTEQGLSTLLGLGVSHLVVRHDAERPGLRLKVRRWVESSIAAGRLARVRVYGSIAVYRILPAPGEASREIAPGPGELPGEDDLGLEEAVETLGHLGAGAAHQGQDVLRVGAAQVDDHVGVLGADLRGAGGGALEAAGLDQPAGVVARGFLKIEPTLGCPEGSEAHRFALSSSIRARSAAGSPGGSAKRARVTIAPLSLRLVQR